jgi:hypothetical protein
MLNEYSFLHIDNSVRGPSRIDVHEHKAPTDASIKLYDEIKEKAYNSIIESFKLENNVVSMVYTYYSDFYAFKNVLKYRFLLNGKEHIGSIEFDPIESKTLTQEKRISAVMQRISNVITVSLMESLEPYVRRELVGF